MSCSLEYTGQGQHGLGVLNIICAFLCIPFVSCAAVLALILSTAILGHEAGFPWREHRGALFWHSAFPAPQGFDLWVEHTRKMPYETNFSGLTLSCNKGRSIALS